MPCLPTRVERLRKEISGIYMKNVTKKQIKTAKQIHAANCVGVCLLSDKA